RLCAPHGRLRRKAPSRLIGRGLGVLEVPLSVRPCPTPGLRLAGDAEADGGHAATPNRSA
ncbi:hypothetical protein Q3365_24505, partial [Salmonella enterica subsp. enterica serovar 1,4,5,12:i:-]|uniref:hypothetical protein n=1 Tax=Salmonella enterica TaxID=28901 RepID=UPI00293FA54F